MKESGWRPVAGFISLASRAGSDICGKVFGGILGISVRLRIKPSWHDRLAALGSISYIFARERHRREERARDIERATIETYVFNQFFDINLFSLSQH